jgi:hypothetical protein
MSGSPLSTPVAFLIFNRPDTTQRVFAEIARARPPRLLVVADGARADRPQEAQRCAQARAIIERVDWPCELETNFSDVNLGCRRRVSSGLDWVFARVPEAIILEDDCLPAPGFFPFCEQMLARYRDDARIGMISGDNFQRGQPRGAGSYYYSKYTHIWGWASWRRAWRHYDVSAALWPELQRSGQFERLTLTGERDTWRAAFEGVHTGRIDTWDYQWTLAFWCHSMLALMPQRNLVSNIGFGEQATHTRSVTEYANMPTEELAWPLVAPRLTAADAHADEFTARRMFWVRAGPLRRLAQRLFGGY